MSPLHARSICAFLMALLCVGVTTGAGSAQEVYAYTEPSPCTIYFQPNSKVTHHAGGLFEVKWYIDAPQYGPVTYHGQPDPVISDDGTLKWTNPTANVTCFTDWYYLYPTYNMEAKFRWHINYYGGSVTTCSGGGGGPMDPFENDPSYDPYDPYSDVYGDACSNGSGGGTGDSGSGGDNCHSVYIYIDESNDGGNTWHEIWEGWATVCE